MVGGGGVTFCGLAASKMVKSLFMSVLDCCGIGSIAVSPSPELALVCSWVGSSVEFVCRAGVGLGAGGGVWVRSNSITITASAGVINAAGLTCLGGVGTSACCWQALSKTKPHKILRLRPKWCRIMVIERS